MRVFVEPQRDEPVQSTEEFLAYDRMTPEYVADLLRRWRERRAAEMRSD